MEILKTCEYCGNRFIAHSFNARFCSKQCTDKAYKNKLRDERFYSLLSEEERNAIKKEEEELANKPILSPTDAAKLVGVSRATIYRYLATGVFKCIQLRGKTLIRRSDIENAFEQAPEYRKRRNPRGRKPTSAFYTTAQIMDRFNVGKKCVIGRCKKYQIAKFYQGRNVFWNKAEVEKYFSDLLETFNRDEYYSTDEIMEKFNMKRGAVLSFVMRHHIPRVGHDKQTFYSMIHIDKLKGFVEADVNPDYYTIQEIMDKYNMTKDQIGYMVKQYKIQKIRVGNYSRINRLDFDHVLKEKHGDFEIL